MRYNSRPNYTPQPERDENKIEEKVHEPVTVIVDSDSEDDSSSDSEEKVVTNNFEPYHSTLNLSHISVFRVQYALEVRLTKRKKFIIRIILIIIINILTCVYILYSSFFSSRHQEQDELAGDDQNRETCA